MDPLGCESLQRHASRVRALFLLMSDHCPLTNLYRKLPVSSVSGHKPPRGSQCCQALLMEKAGLESRQATTLGQLGSTQISTDGSCSHHYPLKARSRRDLKTNKHNYLLTKPSSTKHAMFKPRPKRTWMSCTCS